MKERGFTLIEMLVAVALFAIVMVVCVGSLLALANANRKMHALQSVMNNLNVTLDGMVRDMRMGSTYDGSVGCGSPSGKDCTGGSTQFSFEPYGNSSTDPATIYKFDTTASDCGQSGSTVGCIMRSRDGGLTFTPITSSDVIINSLTFYVIGTAKGCAANPCDTVQPKVVVVIKGTAPVLNSNTRSSFHVEVTAVQRLLDI